MSFAKKFCSKNPLKMETEEGGPGSGKTEYTKAQVISMSRDADLKSAGYNYVDGAWKPGPNADYKSLYANVVDKYEYSDEKPNNNKIPMTKGKGAKYNISKGRLFGKKGHQKLRKK